MKRPHHGQSVSRAVKSNCCGAGTGGECWECKEIPEVELEVAEVELEVAEVELEVATVELEVAEVLQRSGSLAAMAVSSRTSAALLLVR